MESETKTTPTSLEIPYPDHNLIVRADRLWEGSHGKVQGQLSIRVPSPNGHYTVLLVPQDFGFTAPISRKDLIKYLTERVPKVDWTIVIDDTCDQVITHARKGQPDVQVDPAKITLIKPTYLLYPFLPRNQPTVFFGKKSSCKSTLLLLMALSLGSGWTDNPWFKGILKPVNIGWLDWETDQEGFEYDCKRLADGNGIISCPNLFYRPCGGRSLVDQIEEVKSWADKRELQLLILDSLAPASGGEIKEASTAIGYYQALKFLGRTSASIGHPPKSELVIPSISGAGQFEDLARNIWEVEAEQEEDSSELYQALRHRKNYKTGYLPSRGFKYDFADEIIIIKNDDPNQVVKHATRGSDRQRLLALIKDNPLSAQDIAKSLGLKKDYIQVLLSRSQNRDEVEKRGNEKWGIKE